MDSTKLNKENLIIGVHPLQGALGAGKDIDKVFFQKGLKGEHIKALKIELRALGVYYTEVPIYKLNKITKKNHQGIVAFTSPVAFHRAQEVIQSIYEAGEDPFLLVLDRVSDVRNFGAIVRSAEFFGVHAVIVPMKGSAAINYDAIKTSAGAVFNVKICKEPSLYNTIKTLKNSGVMVVGITEKANKSIGAPSIQKPLALVMGSEEDGISKDLLAECTMALRIDGKGKTGSLNVAVAAGVAMQAYC